ncbi:23 kDa integral membrane protein [Armadillidium vulgare]|nr:23 kDa integral membrane protein [Armadillidium vulgare]
MFVTFEKDVGDYTTSLELTTYLRTTAALIVASTLVILNSLLGCCGAFNISRKTLIAHLTITLICFVMYLASSAILLQNGLEDTNLYPHIQVVMKGNINQYKVDTYSKWKVDAVQEKIGCCGGYGDIDYRSIHIEIPDTCRDPVTGNQYKHDCGEVLSWYMQTKTGWMCGIALGICFFQIFEVVITIMAFKHITKLKRQI